MDNATVPKSGVLREQENVEWPGIQNIYTEQDELAPICCLRDKIFDAESCRSGWDAEKIFRDGIWPRVIVRGALFGSDRSNPPHYVRPEYEFYEEEMKEWWEDDPRDELMPLVTVLQEDQTPEIIHMFPNFGFDGDAVGATVDLRGVRCSPVGGPMTTVMPERLVFDRTGRWGMYASSEEFGLLGGEPDFMRRYVEKAGGWLLIRAMADKYWQIVMNNGDDRWVENYYKLAGWNNPPRRKDEIQP